MKAKIVLDSKALDTELVESGSLSVLSEDRLRILKALNEPKYPAELAKELKMQVQTVYYHIRLLNEAKLIELVEYEETGGALAKKYVAKGDALSIILNEKWKPFSFRAGVSPPTLLKHFISGNFFDGRIVVGSPDPHGKYRSRGSEFCSLEFAMYLGSFASFSYPLFYLDTEIDERMKKDNLVLFGGPKVDTIVDEINSFLPIYFEEKTFAVISKLSGKKYEENVGVVELIDNPFNKSKKILLIAGLNHISTRVAVLSLIKQPKKIEGGNLYNPKVIAKVIEGFDEDGDGIAEVVDILE